MTRVTRSDKSVNPSDSQQVSKPAAPLASTVAKAAKAAAQAVLARDGFEAVKKASVKLTATTTAASEPIDRLSAAEKEQVVAARDGKLGAVAKANYEALVSSAGYQALSAETQTRVLKSFAQQPKAAIASGVLTTLTAEPNFTRLSAAQQAQVLDVFDTSDVAGRGHLLTLLRRDVGGAPALLNLDCKGTTLLASLHGLATGALDPRLEAAGVTRAALLGSVMQEAGVPGQINQSNRGTCTVTSMQYLLCDQNPAEYLRIMKGLLSPAGTVKLRNGDTLRREDDAIAPDSATSRSASERLFQSAMMEYANGGEDYSNGSDKSTRTVLGVQVHSHSGLRAGQQEKGLEALFGRGFDHYTGSFNFKDDGADILGRLAARSPTDTYTRMKWGEGKDGGHAVVVTRVEGGRVYFRNPWGPTSDPVGTTYQDPPRTLENPALREESMSEADFKKWVDGVMLPD